MQWADLYVAWNIAFVANVPDFPYYLPKLLIPSVSSYQNQPETFKANRANALNMLFDWGINRLDRDNFRFNWKTAILIKDMGKANYLSAEDYIHRLAYAISKTSDQLRDYPDYGFHAQIQKARDNQIQSANTV